MNKEYLGDGVYIEQDTYQTGMYILTTSNGETTDNTIYLEQSEIDKLNDYVARMKAKQSS